MTSTPSLEQSGARVRLQHMRVDYGDGPAAQVDLDIASGEVLVLLGPSGCGKSTILRALAGLRPIAAGAAELDGIPIRGPGRQCAMVFQDDALLPWRTARRNIEFALALRGVPRGARRAAAMELLCQVGLDAFADHVPGRLSGGMRQRVQLVRTLASQPRVMLMDEPFGALDAQTRAEMQRLLVSVWEQHRMTVLFVTHDVDEALLLADRIVLLTPRPATILRTVEIAQPRSPGARFEPEFARLRYEILATMSDGSEGAARKAMV
jgi:NitT/TauT family transport system ATP-binding protein